MRLCLLAALVGVCSAASAAGPSPSPDRFGPLRNLVGDWLGEEQGRPGRGRGERTYEFVLGGRYLHARNVSRFPPQPANPKGEVHEDWKFFSYDGDEGVLALREFHIEGFVNYYRLDPAASSEKRLVFVSRHLENFAGEARYTVELQGDDAFTELFEVAPKGQPLQVLVDNRWTRRRR